MYITVTTSTPNVTVAICYLHCLNILLAFGSKLPFTSSNSLILEKPQ